MDKLTSILVVIDPADESRHVLNQAMILARHFHARLELFLCDSENAYAFSHSYDRHGILAAREACLRDGRRCTLTSKLVDALDCDFVLVKPETYACPLASSAAATA